MPSLLASQNRDALIIDSVPGLVAILTPSGEIDAVNTQVIDYCGQPLDVVRQWRTNGTVHAEDLPRVVPVFAGAIASGVPYDFDARIRRFDGVYRWFQVRGRPLHAADRRITHWYVLLTDIDDLKHTQEELRRDEAFLAEGQRLSMTGSFVWRLDTDEITFSAELRRIFELEQVPVTLERILSRVHPDDVPLVAGKIELARAGVVDHDYEVRLKMPDDSVKYLRTYAHAMRDPDGHLEFAGAMLDVTQRRESELALQQVRSELAHVARVMTLSALTASIAHEINQPLTGIITNASTCLRMLAAEPPNVDGARETAKRAIRDGERVAHVVARLRGLFTKKDGARERVDVNDAILEVVALFLSEVERARAIVRTELAPDLPQVVGDRVQLQQVILNLMMNAADAMSHVDDRPRELTVRSTLDDEGAIRVSVRDTGDGFEPQVAERMFDAFYSTKTAGMGIGLSISRSIIEQHHGRLWGTRNTGPGATFTFSIRTDTKV